MSTNIIVAQQAARIWSTKDFTKLNEVYAKDCKHYQQHDGKTIALAGIDALKKYMEDFLKTYPDYQEKIVDQIAQGDKVVTVIDCKASAVHWSGVVIDRFEKGKIQETEVWFKRALRN